MGLNLKAQDVYTEDSNYVVIVGVDQLTPYYIKYKIAYLTNANYIIDCKAFLVDTINILDSLIEYEAVLQELPDSGWVEVNVIYNYVDEFCKIKVTHDRTPITLEDPHDYAYLYLFKENIKCHPYKKPKEPEDYYQPGDCVKYVAQSYILKDGYTDWQWNPGETPEAWELME